ncbi:hypothetical protein [Aeromonas salmonicida]|uniref:hypothetical protein n=1 Tax=Aeromonas salmonicida TaxID=645 RepID=UPI0018FEED06|nr:hypothetical protein [Aeromonas salmonicida]
MGKQMDQDKLKALDAELAKDIKSEKDLGTLTQQLITPSGAHSGTFISSNRESSSP